MALEGKIVLPMALRIRAHALRDEVTRRRDPEKFTAGAQLITAVTTHPEISYQAGLLAGIDKIQITARDLKIEYKDTLGRVYFSTDISAMDKAIDILRMHAADPDGIDLLLDHQYYHGYNPETKFGKAPDICAHYVMEAYKAKKRGEDDLYYFNLSLASHYLADLGMPLHTTGALYQFYGARNIHYEYEDYVAANISKFIPIMATAQPIPIPDPATACKELAAYSHQHAVPLHNAVVNRDWATVDTITNDLLKTTCGYVAGLFQYIPIKIYEIKIMKFTLLILIVIGLTLLLYLLWKREKEKKERGG